MNTYERNTCSFVVKVWVEEENEQTAHLLWRGHVTHVFGGKHLHFEALAVIDAFMMFYLIEMGSTLDGSKHLPESVR